MSETREPTYDDILLLFRSGQMEEWDFYQRLRDNEHFRKWYDKKMKEEQDERDKRN